MATILLCTLPLSSATNASLKLAASLRNRGHRVVFIGMKDGAEMLTPYGYEFLSVYEEWFPAGFVKQWVHHNVGKTTWREHLAFLLEERAKLLRHEAFINFLIGGGDAEYLQAVHGLAPDLILVDATLHAHWALLAWRSGVKTMYYNPGLPISEDPAVPPLNSLLPPATDAVSARQVRKAWSIFFARRWRANKLLALAGVTDWIEHLRKLARAYGYPLLHFNTRTELMPLLDLPMLVMCPEEFDFKQAHGRRHIHYGEAFIGLDRKEQAFPWQSLDEGKALVFCSLGSVAYSKDFFQRVIDAVAKEPGWQLVLNLGDSLSADEFQRIPANAILVNGVPQLSLLHKAAVVLTHGGIGTVKESAYFGVPQIVFPIYFDQFGSAARVKYHGIGAAGHFQHSSAGDIHALISDTLLSRGVKSRVQAMSEVFRERESSSVGALFIESHLP